MDVRMLGTGRPFAFECVNPKKTCLSREESRRLEDLVNCQHDGVSSRLRLQMNFC